MPTPNGRAAIPILILGGLVAVGVGAAAIVERIIDSRRDHEPAAPGTRQVGARLPIGLWPSDGSEPMVAHGPSGWREMLAALYHRDTVVDEAARARAVVFAELPRREQDARREVALEAHVLRGVYEPALIAASWLRPLGAMRPQDLAAFGIGETALAAVQASSRLDREPDLSAAWRREFGIDVARPQITDEIVAETGADDRGRLWAVLLELADERVTARHAVAYPSPTA